MEQLTDILMAAWELLRKSSIYVIFGLVVSGLLRVFLSPAAVAHHFGRGRFMPVLKAACLGIPIPLCSCGALPAAVSLKKQGANSGATTAFLISTPESGVDSISITYALLDPLMTLARPVSAFLTALAAGILENLTGRRERQNATPDLTCTLDGCCSGENCPPDVHRRHHSLREKVSGGMRYAFKDIWADLSPWFLLGLLLAGLITVLIPEEFITGHLGGGLSAHLLMLALGIPLYICATASTPVAAALILKGVSPGAALVFLLAGPATNVTSLTVMAGSFGKRTTAIYLSTIAALSVLFGLALDAVYSLTGLSARAAAGQAAELMPAWAEVSGAILLLLLSVNPLRNFVKTRFRTLVGKNACTGRVRPETAIHLSPGSG